MSNQEDIAIDWDAPIVSADMEFFNLDDGDYNFEVSKFEMGRNNKWNCSEAILEFRVITELGTKIIKEKIQMRQKMLWKIKQFLCSMPGMNYSEEVAPKWNKLLGQTGTFSIKTDEYVNDKGETKHINRVDRYIASLPEADGEPEMTF